jgi:ORF6N domain-containing protein
MKRNQSLLSTERIDRLILVIRGQKVLLDRDLATLYAVETRALNQAVKRNGERFPSDFMFELTREEIIGISQIVTSSNVKFSKRVTVFTEQGVAMLSSVLRSKRAILVNIEIMRAFVRLREMLASNRELADKLADLEQHIGTHDKQIQVIFDAIRQLLSPQKTSRRQIGFRVEKEHDRTSKQFKGRHK